MHNKNKKESNEFDTLKKVGFELDKPQDEFSYQPDSGSTAIGAIAKDEYGIDVILDAEGRETKGATDGSEIEDSSLPIPGESEWSQKHRQPEEELSEAPVAANNESLVALVCDRLAQHPNLKQLQIGIFVEQGLVTLRGEVPTDAARILLTDIVEALPGVTSIINEVTIDTFAFESVI